jgi:hypothetical protein
MLNSPKIKEKNLGIIVYYPKEDETLSDKQSQATVPIGEIADAGRPGVYW